MSVHKKTSPERGAGFRLGLSAIVFALGAMVALFVSLTYGAPIMSAAAFILGLAAYSCLANWLAFKATPSAVARSPILRFLGKIREYIADEPSGWDERNSTGKPVPSSK
jgi:hypothetical protein